MMKYLMLSVAFAAGAFASDDRAALQQLRKDLIDVEVNLEQVKRDLPPDLDVTEEKAAIASLAGKAELPPVDFKVTGQTRAPLRDGRPSPVALDRVEISGNGSYDSIHFFLWMLQHQSRPVGVESARFDAVTGDQVRFVAQLVYPRWVFEVPEPDGRTDIVTVYRERLARYRAILDTTVAVLDRIRTDRRLDVLATFTEAANEHAIALTSARIDDGIAIEGFALGAKARAGFASSVEKAKLGSPAVQWTRSGACDAFALKAQPQPGKEGEFISGRSLFDAGAAAFCRGEPEAPVRRVVVRPGKRSGDAFILRLRGIDVADVFFVLNDLIGEDFLIDGDVKGRLDFDVPEGATVDETLDALRSAGIVIGSAPLRYVSRTKRAVGTGSAPSGEPIDVSFRDASLGDVLCLLGQISGRELKMSRGDERRISLFATEMPVGAAIDLLLPPPAAKTVNPCETEKQPPSRLTRYPMSIADTRIADVRLAGVAHFVDTWRAYVYGARRRIMVVEPGQKLADGAVKSIAANGIVLAAGAEAPVTLPLEP